MGGRELREAICDAGRRLHERGFVAAWDGNISHRLPDGTFLCTPTLCPKGRLKPDELCTVDAEGRQLCGPRPRTSELLLHLAIYSHRPDVQAVVHSHPPHATAFAVTGEPIPDAVLPEVEYFLGPVPTVPYDTPGTAQFAAMVVPYLDRTNTLVLSNHGTVSFAATLEQAVGFTEILDAYCRILLLAQPLGSARRLTEPQVAELLEFKRRAGNLDPRL
jgi:L-fuculose-phosphate aldolase